MLRSTGVTDHGLEDASYGDPMTVEQWADLPDDVPGELVDGRLVEEERTLEVFSLDAAGRYVHALGATSGSVGDVPGCPGLVLDLDEMWTEIDQLDDGEPED